MREPSDYLRKSNSREREEQVQRPWGQGVHGLEMTSEQGEEGSDEVREGAEWRVGA